MISKALEFLTEFLNNELKQAYTLTEDLVMPSSLINADGSIPHNIENKIVISVLNVEHETALRFGGENPARDTDKFGKQAPALLLNVYILIAANFTSNKYLEAFKMLSGVISTLREHAFADSQIHPELSPQISTLTFEPYNMPLTELSHIWNGIGAHQVPSIIYKMRIHAISEKMIKEEVPEIKD
jgi:hypothetical protein